MKTVQEYVKVICLKCKNRFNNEDLCRIVHTIDGQVRCENVEAEIEYKKEEE